MSGASNEAESAVAEPQVEESYTPVQREEMKQHILNQMRSTQDLINHYLESTKQLQAEVAEFVVRDVDEENQLHAIAATVEDRQRHALQNPDYLRWAMAQQKGEFAPEHATASDTTVAKKGSVSKSSSSSLSPLSAYVPMPSDVLQPSASVLEEAYPGVWDVLQGYRGMSPAIDQHMTAMGAQLAFDALHHQHQFPASCGPLVPSGWVLFVNGAVVFPDSLRLTSPEQVMAFSNFAEQQRAEDAAPWTVESLLCVWRDFCFAASAVTTGCKEEDLQSQLAAQVIARLHSATLAQLNHGTVRLALVPLARCMRGVTVRYVTKGGTLRNAEILGPHGNVLLPLQIEASSLLALGQRIAAAAMVDSRTGGAGGGPWVYTVLVQRSPTAAATTEGTTFSELSALCVDARKLTPSDMQDGFTTWAELCGVLRSEEGEGDEGSATCGRLRYVEHQLAALGAGRDAFQQAWFPILNEVLNVSRQTAQVTLPSERHADPTGAAALPSGIVPASSSNAQGSSASWTVGAALGGAVAVMAVSVAATVLVMKGKR